MFSRKTANWIGLLLIAVGLSTLVYTGYSYYQFMELEKALEAQVPGQETDVPGSTPVALAPPPRFLASERTVTPAIQIGRATLSAPGRLTGTEEPLDHLTHITPGPNTPTPTIVRRSSGLRVGTGVKAARLVIPRLKLNARVREASVTGGRANFEWDIPFDAVGHLFNTANPGESVNVVMAGHHNLTAPNQHGLGLFAGLWNMRGNDPIYLIDQVGRTFEYRVTQSYSIKEEGEPLAVRQLHAQGVLFDDGQPRLTLITCWNGEDAPLSGNTYRWIVSGPLVGVVGAGQLPAARN